MQQYFDSDFKNTFKNNVLHKNIHYLYLILFLFVKAKQLFFIKSNRKYKKKLKCVLIKNFSDHNVDACLLYQDKPNYRELHLRVKVN